MLIESMIAIIVVAIGVLGLTRLNGVLLQGAGTSKTRAEATQIAQDLLEQAREQAAASACGAFADVGGASSTGVNASYTSTIDYTASDADSDGTDERVAIDVTVSWTNSDGSSESATLSSIIGCLPADGQSLVDTNRSLGGFVKNPTGRGVIGGDNNYENGSVPGTANTIGQTDLTDGTKTNVTEQGLVEIIDDLTGDVLLSFQQTGCEMESEDDTGFSTVSGRLFIETKNGNPIVEKANLFVLSSDASYCTVLDYTNQASWVVSGTVESRDVSYVYTYYQCYIGPEWWGNIGTVRVDSANTNDRVCVGNPGTDTAADTLFSTTPAKSSARGYRGYTDIGGGLYESRGIGILDDAECGYVAQHYEDHHLVLANITGSESCVTKEEALNAIASSVLSASEGYSGNPGKFFCMTNYADDPVCPNLSDPYIAASTVVHGTITRTDTDSAILTAIDSGSTACTTSSISLAEDGASYAYSCDINWTGFTGESWYGTIAFDVGDATSLCATNVSDAVVPAGTSVAYVINTSAVDIDAGEVPNALYFTDIPMSVTDVEVNFDIAYGGCGAIGTPNVYWAGASDPKTLAWSAVPGATEYKVYRCSTASNRELTSCTREAMTLEATVTSQDYDPGSVSNKQTICVSVSASDGVNESEVNPVKCIFQQGNSYTYQ